IMATFAAGALVISGGGALLSFDLTRNTLLDGRQRSAVRNAFFDAKVVQAGLTGSDPDVLAVLRSLDTGTSRHAVIVRAGHPYARTADAGLTAAIPGSLQAMTVAGHPGIQR